MQSLPVDLIDNCQLMKEHFAFELIDENKHRTWLETMMTEEQVVRALRSWTFGGIGTEGPQFYKLTRVIKRLEDNAYICYSDGMLIKLTDTTYKLMNGGRMMHPDSRDRGILTKAIADEGIDYFFQRFPWTVDEIEVQLPSNFNMSKRSTSTPEISSYGENSYSRITWTRQAYLDSL